MACIYVITNKINNKQYVGQTIKTADKRFIEHACPSDDWLLGRAIRKYGKSNFAIKEYSDIREEWIDWFEQMMIQHCKSLSPNGYNIHLGGQGNRLFSTETKKRISESKKGQEPWIKGKHMPKDSIEIGRLKHLGYKWTEKQKSNLSKIRKAHPEKYASMKGRKHSEETKKKMSESAKKIIHTPEWNKHVSEGQKGKIISEETRAKLRAANIGKIVTDEYRKKQREIMLKIWEKRKENKTIEGGK